MITNEQVVSIVNSDDLDPRIEAARKMNLDLLRHVEGIGTDEYLERINQYENELQHEARTKHAITNEAITEELLRPADNIFSAKGGSEAIKFKTNQDKNTIEIYNKLSSVKNGLSLSEYIEQVWFQKLITDPNGLIFIETNTETQEIYPTYKSIQKIRAYEQAGIYVKWVIFEPYKIYEIETTENKKKTVELFWVVDESKYYLYEKTDDNIKLIDEIDHNFKKVPAVLCSNIIDSKTGWKKSPIDKQIKLLDKYLTMNSVLSISEFQSVYYREWEYAPDCPDCRGEGTIEDEGGSHTCTTCGGTGLYVKRDVTDITRLRVPSPGDNEATIAPPFGIEAPPTDGWELMVSSTDRYAELAFRSEWGATLEKKDNETATGRFIDVQPVNNRLDKYSHTTEVIHTAIINLYGVYYFEETFEKAIKLYGRRYLIETPDQIWEKYTKAVNENVNVVGLNLLLDQFYESEFRENKELYIYYTNLTALDPFPHWDVDKVKGLGVSDVDYARKLYINEFKETKSIKQVVDTKFDDLKKEYIEFINQKIEVEQNLKENEQNRE